MIRKAYLKISWTQWFFGLKKVLSYRKINKAQKMFNTYSCCTNEHLNFEQLQILSSIECRKKLHPTTSHFYSKIMLCSAQSTVERDNFVIAFAYAMIFIFLSITALNGIYPHLIYSRKKGCSNSCMRQGISCFQRSVMISVIYLFENSPSENPSFSRYREYCLVSDKCLTWHSLKTFSDYSV